jgi:hypothetical protein
MKAKTPSSSRSRVALQPHGLATAERGGGASFENQRAAVELAAPTAGYGASAIRQHHKPLNSRANISICVGDFRFITIWLQYEKKRKHSIAIRKTLR